MELDLLIQLMFYVDVANIGQADTFIDSINLIVDTKDESDEEFSNKYPETTTPTASGGGGSSGGGGDSGGTTAAPTTTTTMKTPEEAIKGIKDVMKLMNKLTDTKILNSYIPEREFEIRIRAAGAIGEFMSMKGKYANGFRAMNDNPDEPNPHELQDKLVAMVQYLLERRVPNDRYAAGEHSVMVSKPNFAMLAFKVSASTYRTKGQDDAQGYWKFPDQKLPEWRNAINKFGELGSYEASETVQGNFRGVGTILCHTRIDRPHIRSSRQLVHRGVRGQGRHLCGNDLRRVP